MPEYTVVDGHKIHDKKTYAPGDTMNVPEDVAKRLRLAPGTEKKKLNAEDIIALINDCKTVDEVDAAVGDDKRKTVIEAAGNKKAELTKK